MLSQPRRTAVSTAVLALALALAGCQPATTTPAPVPSYRCTPEAGGAEFDCSQHQYDDMVAKDQLYDEAEAVYRKFFAEDVRIYRAGGISEPTPILLETTTGDFLADSMDLYRSLKESQTQVVGGEILLVSLMRESGVSRGGSLVSMRACIDGSSTRVQTKGRKPERGGIGVDVVHFTRPAGEGLKIDSAQSKEVAKC